MEKICSISEIPAGSMKGFTINGKQILIANTEGSFFAIDAVCSHMQGYLPSGRLSGKTVTCPVHGAQYDLATGKVLTEVPWILKMATRRNATDLGTYAIEEKDGQIFVDAAQPRQSPPAR
jgi:nitrite reductase/ring-hydroxylating ferredoxin subunit